MTAKTVVEPGADAGVGAGAPRPRSVLRMLAFGTGLFVLASFATGFVIGWRKHHDAFNAELAIALGVFALLIGSCAWLLAREIRRPAGGEPLTPMERTNLNLVLVATVFGAVMGGVMAIGGGSEPFPLFSDGPISPVIAMTMIAGTALTLPLAVKWHRAVDEQEEDAYKTGALYALYVYWIGAPIWWFAWRGGFAPEPNGVAIFFATIVTAGAIWMWKKYR